MSRVRLIISGDVQGIGFRSWIKYQARQLGINGWVKNREDNTVEVLAEGEKDKIEELIKYCKKGPELAWVQKVDIEWQKAEGKFLDFMVVY